MTRVAGAEGDTSADNVAQASGTTVAPRPYVLDETPGPLGHDELTRIAQFWRAANYLSVAKLLRPATPLWAEPLGPAPIKPRLLGHFGTVPGLNLVWAHANRQIR